MSRLNYRTAFVTVSFIPLVPRGPPAANNHQVLILYYLKDIRRYVATGDVARFERVKAMLEHPDQIQTLQANPRYGVYQNSPSGPASNGMANNYHNGTLPVAYRSGMSESLLDRERCSRSI